MNYYALVLLLELFRPRDEADFELDFEVDREVEFVDFFALLPEAVLERLKDLLPTFLEGTLPSSFLASESPIAIACLRFVTVFPERPDLSFPSFISFIARLTFDAAFAPYLVAI
jgi:hypothetical protein